LRKFRISTSSILVTALTAAALFASISAQTVVPSAPKPVKYGIVVDSSGSMRMLLEDAVAMVKSIVDENQPGDQTFLVRFVSSDKIVLVAEMSTRKDEIKDAADQIYIEGGQTAILDALQFSSTYLNEKEPDLTASKALILITDGDERGSSTKAEKLVEQLKQSDIRVFVIGISDLKVETKTLDKLVKGTAGKIFLPRGGTERRSAAKAVASAIRGN
jgi:Mg-chelatase subunit ChlD